MREIRKIAKRECTTETTIAIISCKLRDEHADFEETLSAAITEWGQRTDAGVKSMEYTCEDFNYGDLAVESSPHLDIILDLHGIIDLKIEVMSLTDDYLNFDRRLYNPE